VKTGWSNCVNIGWSNCVNTGWSDESLRIIIYTLEENMKAQRRSKDTTVICNLQLRHLCCVQHKENIMHKIYNTIIHKFLILLDIL
jgi:hypothetical protein